MKSAMNSAMNSAWPSQTASLWAVVFSVLAHCHSITALFAEDPPTGGLSQYYGKFRMGLELLPNSRNRI